ncbi:hypothetical protein BDV19DRAFT_372719 [Aspergillus venezuelensis]
MHWLMVLRLSMVRTRWAMDYLPLWHSAALDEWVGTTQPFHYTTTSRQKTRTAKGNLDSNQPGGLTQPAFLALHQGNRKHRTLRLIQRPS